jgi:hypothetical protein
MDKEDCQMTATPGFCPNCDFCDLSDENDCYDERKPLPSDKSQFGQNKI